MFYFRNYFATRINHHGDLIFRHHFFSLGPGFCAGKDVHVVVETMRGHNLGRLIYQGYALPNTGVPLMQVFKLSVFPPFKITR